MNNTKDTLMFDLAALAALVGTLVVTIAIG